jgi:hypothetical protein
MSSFNIVGNHLFYFVAQVPNYGQTLIYGG